MSRNVVLGCLRVVMFFVAGACVAGFNAWMGAPRALMLWNGALGGLGGAIAVDVYLYIARKRRVSGAGVDDQSL